MSEQTAAWPGSTTVTGPDDGPPVLLLHPWWGVVEGVLAWRDALVEAGARVVLPDLYDGRTAATVDDAMALMKSYDRDAALVTVEGCADRLAADGRPFGAVGFSMGASYAGHLAGRGDRSPQRVVLFYGGGIPDGPGATAGQLHLAPGDDYFEDDEVTEVVDGFRAVGVELEQHVYDGAGHWFAEKGSPGYDEQAAALATRRSLEFLGLRT